MIYLNRYCKLTEDTNMLLKDCLTAKGKRYLESFGYDWRNSKVRLGSSYECDDVTKDGLPYNCGATVLAASDIKSCDDLVFSLLAISDHVGIVIVTINGAQSKKAKMFTDFGFQSTAWIRNPNSRNKIRAFTTTLPSGLVNWNKLDRDW